MSMNRFDQYMRLVRSRCEAGALEYGDASFQRSPGELLVEIQEEIADISGWAYVLYERVERLKELALQTSMEIGACYGCVAGCTDAADAAEMIRSCTATDCRWHRVRPYQRQEPKQ